jgi:hypothetical protein
LRLAGATGFLIESKTGLSGFFFRGAMGEIIPEKQHMPAGEGD